MAGEQMVDVSVIIVNWNARRLLRECLKALFEGARGLALQVFVVDNASSDLSVRMVGEEFPQVHVIENPTNVGFAAANNQAFPSCSGDSVLLLNPDARIRESALGLLVEYLREHAEVGAVAPKLVQPDGLSRVLSCGYQPTLRTLFNHYLFLSRLFPQISLFRGLHLLAGVHDDKVRRVEWLSGACILVRKQVVQQVGPLSQRWFMYAEDMEWCDRIARSGWELHHLPGAVAEHDVGGSAGANQELSTLWMRSLRSYFAIREHSSRLKLFLFDWILTIGMMLRALYFGLRARIDPSRGAMWQTQARRFRSYALAATQMAQQ